ncbi:hypothetical protein GUITHDRAFT_104154 [Guillardia theta CCMP2712]|uniref:Transcription and mRNA export factor ENY2 n=1 Tax=Guillardia theta (strain CCMP2712) TaxID=905079 RepID=L1JQ09_GUITC|nr:hypothetical protein GUITHDRAFT_104154 [Guillardia theta CCMP2712]EKX50344.1 hypothetical protein GUITHDRAFT_104154 [Guillardia theta CCMP2712]|eukprot:XP_005837324.1 hypothetical protein GUITHDRAFT_104154 [Guillardia theta CCMP2712]
MASNDEDALRRRDRLKEILKKRLQEVGWEEEMQDYCRELIQNKSLEHIDVPKLVQEIAQKSRAAVPDNIREEISSQVKYFLQHPSKE